MKPSVWDGVKASPQEPVYTMNGVVLKVLCILCDWNMTTCNTTPEAILMLGFRHGETINQCAEGLVNVGGGGFPPFSFFCSLLR